jgi:hypothetical protein
LRSAAKDALAGTPASEDRAERVKVHKTAYGPGGERLRAVAAPAESPAAAAVWDAPAPSRWHLAACWRALESVADQLGDPPRASRYAELAGARDDLPSPPTVRARLGPWSGIAAALAEQEAARGGRQTAQTALARADEERPANRPGAAGESRNGRRTAKESIGDGRLATQVEVAVLRHLAQHPGSSGTEVRDGAGIRSKSQTWTLLARLEREGLLVNEANAQGKAWKNAWRLSARGRNVLNGLPEGMYARS